MLKISYTAFLCLSQLVSAQFALELSPSLKSPKNSQNPVLAFKVIEFGVNREPVYDFLLVINSNLGPNSLSGSHTGNDSSMAPVSYTHLTLPTILRV